MNYTLNPFVRFAAKTNYLIEDKTIIPYDCHILYNLTGTGYFSTQGKTYSIKPNTLIYYPYGIPYSIKSDSDDMLFYTVNFDFSQKFSNCEDVLRPVSPNEYDPQKNLESIPTKLLQYFSNHIYIENAFGFEKYFEDIYTETTKRFVNWRSIQNSNMQIILDKLHRKMIVPQKSNPICDEIKRIVKTQENINCLKIAEQLGYHPNYLNELFKKNEGITLHQYVLQKKLEKAYELICSTNLSYEEIAYVCGFSSSSHLTTSIRMKYNLTPSEIRKQL